MEKTLSRKKTRWGMAFMWAAVFFAVVMLLTGGAIGSILAIACVVLGAIMMLITNRCPHCKTTFRGGSWDKPHAGYCNKCGKLMEYDDTVARRNRKKEEYE